MNIVKEAEKIFETKAIEMNEDEKKANKAAGDCLVYRVDWEKRKVIVIVPIDK